MTKEESMQAYPPEPECPLTEEEKKFMKENWWQIEATPEDKLLGGYSDDRADLATAYANAYFAWCEKVDEWQKGHPNTQAREVIAWAENALDEARTGERSVREAIELVEYTIKLNPLGLVVMPNNDRKYVDDIRGELSAKLTAYAA